MRRSTVALLTCIATAAFADGLPDGVGVETPSGSVFTSAISPAGDADDYVFRGYPGMTVTATARSTRRSGLTPVLQILRPGGAVVGDDEGLALALTGRSASAELTLDATGWWKVRVLGAGDTTGGYAVSVKYGAPKLAPLPAVVRSIAARAAIAPAFDFDEFAVAGFAGQKLTASLSVAKGSALNPQMRLIRPDGTVAADAGIGTDETKLALAATLDSDGTWRVRVAGDDAEPAPPIGASSTGAYAIRVKLSAASPGLLPDANGQYRLALPAVGGARIAYELTFLGNAPTFNSFVDPQGRPVPGFEGGLLVTSFALPTALAFGEYRLTFDAPAGAPPDGVTLTRSLQLPRPAAKRVATLATAEPAILVPDGISPTSGGAGTIVSVRTANLADPNAPGGAPAIFIGHTALAGVTVLPDGVTVRGTLLDDLPFGDYDVVVAGTSGQVAARAGAFRVVPPPTLEATDSTAAPTAGGSDVVLTGRNFGTSMGITFDGVPQPVATTVVSPTTLRFTTPPHAAGVVVLGVRDLTTGLADSLPEVPFEYVVRPIVSRVSPPVLPVLSADTVTLEGFEFAATDKVFLETAVPGVFEEITASQTTWTSATRHRFAAPLRPRGEYRVYVTDASGEPSPPRTKLLTYFAYSDVTAGAGPLDEGVAAETVTSALADIDGDQDLDLVLSRRGGAAAAPSSLTRVLRNDGHGTFADVTASVMPAAGIDDWRADRIAPADIDGDGFADVVLATNSVAVPPAGASHTRILMNEVRGGSGAGAADRVLRDRTAELMAPVRRMKTYGLFSGGGVEYVSDPWRALDVWVGDLDANASGPPDIVVTHDEVKDDDNYHADTFQSGVYAGNYGAVPGGSFAYAYSFYWGGSRHFVWDKTARGGLGRYKFDPNYFPRRSGPLVPSLAPGGGVIVCSANYNSRCKDTFTPFKGQRLAVGDLNDDGRPDVAVVSAQPILRRAKVNDPLLPISALQVGLAGANPIDGAGITDVTAKFTALALDLRGDAVAIGPTGFPDGNTFGTIAVAKRQPGAGLALTLLRCTSGGLAPTFADVTALELPAPPPGDAFEASEVRFADVDADGDLDLVLLAPAAPGGTGSALRVLRNDDDGVSRGVFSRALEGVVAANVTASDHLEGDALSIGDVSGDGLADYVIGRAVPVLPGTQTRILGTRK